MERPKREYDKAEFLIKTGPKGLLAMEKAGREGFPRTLFQKPI
jgi:hypothetical protein